MMSDIVLFDLDGTLTPPRQAMPSNVAQSLINLSTNIADVGIVTGSPIEYIREQCEALFEKGRADDDASAVLESILFFPCNETQQYSWDTQQSDLFLINATNMRQEMGEYPFYNLMKILVGMQNHFVEEFVRGIPMTGDFISYRGSMINWCPVGRNATMDDRAAFIERDRHWSIRQHLLDRLVSFISKDEKLSSAIDVVLGGQTSFDIYPKGWDKTYTIQHIQTHENFWFVGNECKPGGNDYALYVAAEDRGFATTSPDETVRIIDEEIKPLIQKSYEEDDDLT